MSDLENMDAMLGNYPEKSYDIQGDNYESEINSRLNRQDQKVVHNDKEFRFYLNTNLSKKLWFDSRIK